MQFQYVKQNPAAGSAAGIELANCAIDHYQVVIDSYLQKKKPEASLREAAAWAYYGSGVVYHESEELEAARQVFDQVLRLTETRDLQERARNRLSELDG